MATPIKNPGPQGYWGVIQAAVAQRLNTAALWAKISAYEVAQAITRPANLFTAVSQMRSLAATQRNTSEVLGRAADAQAIDSTMIAQAVNARPLNEQVLAPINVVRFEATVLTSEGESTQWLSMLFHGNLPATKGELVDQLTGTAIDATTGYGSVFTGLTGNMQITAK